MVKVVLGQDILQNNNLMARDNRSLLELHGLRALNVISSPGAGKTSLLVKTIEILGGRLKLGVVEGDICTLLDADRIEAAGARAVQINTGGLCHLNAPLVGEALGKLPLDQLDLVVIENVGNLVCPAAFELGEHLKVVLLSVAEGGDKPVKYPGTFLAAQVCVITKIDLLNYTDFNLDQCIADIKAINSSMVIFTTSARTGEGMGEWCRWLEQFAARGKGEGC